MKILNEFWEHLTSWAELYLWVPIALLMVPLTIETHYYMVGRPSGEDPYQFLVGMAPRFVAIVIAITLSSIYQEARGGWLTREQKIESPLFSSVQSVCSMIIVIAFAWLLSR